MHKFISGLVIFFGTCCYGQTAETFLELQGDNLIKFYFDEQYYLVDKNCEFLRTIRISAFDKTKNIFAGEFTDYDADSKVILTGSYYDGMKEGTFKSFYSNGFLKWQGDYKQNQATGLWNFFFPDGTPSIIAERNYDTIRVIHAWDEKGNQIVKNGSGKYSLDDYLLGFNEIGYTGLGYSGKLKSGLQDGLWRAEYIFAKNKREQFYSEMYTDGRLNTPSFVNTAGISVKLHHPSQTKLLPTEYFQNAEELVSKKCTIDDNTGFTIYLEDKLNSVVTIARVTTQDISQPIEISMTVSEKGKSSDIKIIPQLQTELYSLLQKMISNLPFWIPSQKDGKLVRDTFTIRTLVFFDKHNNPSFSLPVIKRLNGK